MSELLNVGDTLVVKNIYCHTYKITRVTKTLAMSERDNGCEHKFKRKISHNMQHPQEKWNTSTYEVLKLT